LHEYLQYFIKNPPLNRPQQLKALPDEFRKEVSDRLTQFDVLPPELKQEALSQAATADYFWGPGSPDPRGPRPTPPMPQVTAAPDPIKALSELPEAERAGLFSTIEDFFELDQPAQQKVIAAIPAAQRGQVAAILWQIKRQPREQREQTLEVLRTVAAMTDRQRQLFFTSAERWKAMSESERSTWLRLVSHLPSPPPLPMPPPRPPGGRGVPPSTQPLSFATNPGS
jgi:hypothetical protein